MSNHRPQTTPDIWHVGWGRCIPIGLWTLVGRSQRPIQETFSGKTQYECPLWRRAKSSIFVRVDCVRLFIFGPLVTNLQIGFHCHPANMAIPDGDVKCPDRN